MVGEELEEEEEQLVDVCVGERVRQLTCASVAF